MKIIQKGTPTEPVRDIDWTQPLFVFDPWPFKQDKVELADDVIYWNGCWSEGPGWVLDKGYDDVLGMTTLGETFVSSQESLDMS